MPKKKNVEDIKKVLKEMYPDQVFDFSTYKNTSSIIKVIDPDYGEWYPSVHNLLSKKRKHRKRRDNESKNRLLLDISIIIERIKEIHQDLITIDVDTYINTNTKCRFIDKDFGEFFALPYHVMSGHGHVERGRLKQIKSSILPIEDVKNRLFHKHKGIIKIVDTTYKGMYHHALFIHKIYGEWWAIPNNVIEKGSSHPDGAVEKSIATCYKNYNVNSPMQNTEIFKKAARSRWKRVILQHWKTGKDIICTSSYEYAIVKELNNKKIDYNWQIKIFLPHDIVYYVDLFLVKENKFIEIKGYFFSERNRMKWELFHSIYNNSEIWFEKEVKEFTKKSSYMIKKEFKKDWINETKRNMG